MTPERWRQVEKLYRAALELEPAARADFLASACAADTELREELKSLLVFNDQKRTFIESPAVEVVAQLLSRSEKHLTGHSFGPYRIVQFLGSGGMGEVYLARDGRLDRNVALKLLPFHFTILAEHLIRFKKEARVAAALNHPNIVTIYEIGEFEGEHLIAAEFVDGLTLRKRLTEGAMGLLEAVRIVVQISSALGAAHQAGVIHCDIKPENIMLRRDGYVKVLDFGLAKLAGHGSGASGEQTPSTATMPGMVVGTVRYMSPEQARGAATDPRTDIFSLGIVLYEMVTGRLPFEGASTSDQIAALLVCEPPPPSQYAPMPTEFERIIQKMLAKKVDERHQTAADLQANLEGLKRDLEFESKLEEWASAPRSSPQSVPEARWSGSGVKLEPVGGAVPLDSGF